MTGGREPGRQRGSVVIVIAHDECSAEITIEGRTQVVTGAIPKETRRAALDAATAYAAHLGRSVLVNARDANGAWQLIISPTGVVRAAGGSEAELVVRPDTQGRGRGRKIALALTGGALAVLAAVGVGAVWVVRGSDVTGTEVNGGDIEGSGIRLETRPRRPGSASKRRGGCRPGPGPARPSPPTAPWPRSSTPMTSSSSSAPTGSRRGRPNCPCPPPPSRARRPSLAPTAVGESRSRTTRRCGGGRPAAGTPKPSSCPRTPA